MQFKDAAYEILKKAKEPLHYNAITDRALAAGILSTEGQTPHASMGALLYTDTLKENSRFRRGDRKGYFTLRTEPPNDIKRQILAINTQVRKTLHNRLLQMDPRKFENLVKSLLDEMGLEETTVTTYSGDGGIDVRGTLNAENLSRIQVAVQAKRWKGNVGPKIVRELRGSLMIHEHGIVITPSDFTASAVKEADGPGKTHISLISGAELVDLLIEHQVGVANVEHTVHVLDEEYWSEILGEGTDRPAAPPPPKSIQKTPQVNLKPPLPIIGKYKGVEFHADLLDISGRVRYQGAEYATPTAAAKATGLPWKEVNGWDFWKYLDPQSGNLLKIGALRIQN